MILSLLEEDIQGKEQDQAHWAKDKKEVYSEAGAQRPDDLRGTAVQADRQGASG